MRIIADLQIHSKYSRACSQDLNPKNIGAWADKKGIAIIGTGDFTHPKWLAELKEALEVSSIYKQGDKVRRVHNMIFAPNFEAVDKIITGLEKTGANLKADGRPI